MRRTPQERYREKTRGQAICDLNDARERMAELEEALRGCVALAAAHVGGYAASQGLKDYDPTHKEIINRAQRLLGGRELP